MRSWQHWETSDLVRELSRSTSYVSIGKGGEGRSLIVTRGEGKKREVKQDMLGKRRKQRWKLSFGAKAVDSSMSWWRDFSSEVSLHLHTRSATTGTSSILNERTHDCCVEVQPHHPCSGARSPPSIVNAFCCRLYRLSSYHTARRFTT